MFQFLCALIEPNPLCPSCYRARKIYQIPPNPLSPPIVAFPILELPQLSIRVVRWKRRLRRSDFLPALMRRRFLASVDARILLGWYVLQLCPTNFPPRPCEWYLSSHILFGAQAEADATRRQFLTGVDACLLSVGTCSHYAQRVLLFSLS